MDTEDDTGIKLTVTINGGGVDISTVLVEFNPMWNEEGAARELLAVIARSLGANGVNMMAPMEGGIDVTAEYAWLKWFSEIGPDARRDWAQRTGCDYADLGQACYDPVKGAVALATGGSGVVRFAKEYNSPGKPTFDTRAPEYHAQMARQTDRYVRTMGKAVDAAMGGPAPKRAGDQA